MTQQRRTIDKLTAQGILPPEHANTAASYLEVYPNKRDWLAFFDKALLIIGVVALALALVFFIAYNWLYLGKSGKFALVEGALVLTIAAFTFLAYRRKFQLAQQLLLFIASIITGSLLALFGQVYQTGADTWQLFANWALLIVPWVVIARMPALWLLWLGLINASLMLYTAVSTFFGVNYFNQAFVYLVTLTALNFIALNLWLLWLDKKPTTDKALINIPSKVPSKLPNNDLSNNNLSNNNLSNNNLSNNSAATSNALNVQIGYHWSTYVVGLLSTYWATRLAIVDVNHSVSLTTIASILLWIAWSAFMFWRFYKARIDLLMLTYLCGSGVVVIMVWLANTLLRRWDSGGFLVLALLLIALSSGAVIWLRRVALQTTTTTTELRGHCE
ncbi:DUF2157 domain-containing protein [Psychrobacter pygoscelis]|uniref:DUF2157 domain-containing protein n=1 Tax=Psychrobacter pygoscelis TaxID=2488563 RepID=UPI00104079C2|nr:DUF2157 domain-containing protein [Psychrobacter pygoscelis]